MCDHSWDHRRSSGLIQAIHIFMSLLCKCPAWNFYIWDHYTDLWMCLSVWLPVCFCMSSVCMCMTFCASEYLYVRDYLCVQISLQWMSILVISVYVWVYLYDCLCGEWLYLYVCDYLCVSVWFNVIFCMCLPKALCRHIALFIYAECTRWMNSSQQTDYRNEQDSLWHGSVGSGAEWPRQRRTGCAATVRFSTRLFLKYISAWYIYFCMRNDDMTTKQWLIGHLRKCDRLLSHVSSWLVWDIHTYNIQFRVKLWGQPKVGLRPGLKHWTVYKNSAVW